MKVSFILLAHEPPERLKDLLLGLLKAGSNVYIHHDATASGNLESALAEWQVDELPGQVHFAERVKVVWGEWSIVQATLNCMRLARQLGDDSDYYTLLSGSCMPVKPISVLASYLERTGCDHIETVNAQKNKWVTAGLQKQRWTKYHFFNWRFQPKRFHASLAIQRQLKIKRPVPKKHVPHMGSQWWCLRYSTVMAVLSFLDSNPTVEKFYRRTWVPDELFFQTLVANLVPREEIVSRPLTRYAFNSWGIPRVYYEDDAPELLAESRFFVRKVSHRAPHLKAWLSNIASMSVDEYQGLLTSSDELLAQLKDTVKRKHLVEANRWHALDSFEENPYDFIKSIPNRVVVVCGMDSEKKSQALAEIDKLDDTAVYGDLFDPDEVGKGYEHTGWLPIKRVDTTLARHTWHNLLGDIAFQEHGKTIVFSLGKHALKYLEVLRWKKGLNILLVDDESRDGLDRATLKELYFKSQVLNLIKDRHCELARVDLRTLQGFAEKACDAGFDSEYLIDCLHSSRERVRWPSLLTKQHDHWALLKAIKTPIVVFVSGDKTGKTSVNTVIENWLGQGVHTGIFDVLPVRDQSRDWHYYLADVTKLNNKHSRHKALYVHMPASQVVLLDALRWKQDLLVVALECTTAPHELDSFTYTLEGSLEQLREVAKKSATALSSLDEIMRDRFCSYLRVSPDKLDLLRSDVENFVLDSLASSRSVQYHNLKPVEAHS